MIFVFISLFFSLFCVFYFIIHCRKLQVFLGNCKKKVPLTSRTSFFIYLSSSLISCPPFTSSSSSSVNSYLDQSCFSCSLSKFFLLLKIYFNFPNLDFNQLNIPFDSLYSVNCFFSSITYLLFLLYVFILSYIFLFAMLFIISKEHWVHLMFFGKVLICNTIFL